MQPLQLVQAVLLFLCLILAQSANAQTYDEMYGLDQPSPYEKRSEFFLEGPQFKGLRGMRGKRMPYMSLKGLRGKRAY